MSRSNYGSSTNDSKSRDPSISSTAKITAIMVPNPSIVEIVFPLLTMIVNPLVSLTTKIATTTVLNSSTVEKMLLHQ